MSEIAQISKHERTEAGSQQQQASKIDRMDLYRNLQQGTVGGGGVEPSSLLVTNPYTQTGGIEGRPTGSTIPQTGGIEGRPTGGTLPQTGGIEGRPTGGTLPQTGGIEGQADVCKSNSASGDVRRSNGASGDVRRSNAADEDVHPTVKQYGGGGVTITR